MRDRRARGKRRRDADEAEAVAGEESSDEEMGNTKDSDWRERAARARREQRAAEAKRRRGSVSEDGVA